MIEVKVNIDDTAVQSRLDSLLSTKRIQSALLEASTYIKSRVRIYPPQPSGSTYRRKGAAGGLASGWIQAQPEARNLSVFVANNIPYATYVQGDKQMWWHKRTGWRNIDDVLEATADRVAKIVRNAIAKG